MIAIFGDKDPPRINKNVKQLILEKNRMYKKYVKEKYLIKLNKNVKQLFLEKIKIYKKCVEEKYLIKLNVSKTS